MTDRGSRIDRIHRAIVEQQDKELGPTWRLLKLQEEAGEVAEAYIGCTGANRRKGLTHSASDVAAELCDVIVTAMVALRDWTEDPEEFLDAHIDKLMTRGPRKSS